MRRSTKIVISGLAFSATTPLLNACSDDPPNIPIYTSVQACSIGNKAADCQAAFDQAVKKWRALPGYSTMSDCQMGEGEPCDKREDGTYYPPMVGFMLDKREVTYQKDRRCDDPTQAKKNDACPQAHYFGFFYRNPTGLYAYYANGVYVSDSSSVRSGTIDVARAKSNLAEAQEEAAHEASDSDHGGFGDSAGGHAGGE